MALVIRTTGLEQYAPGGEARLKLLIIGGPGAGKTRYASYFPRPIYADCEAGLASVADRNVPYVSISTSDDMLDLLTHLKQECTMPKDRRTYDTVVIDTLDAYQRKLKNEWMEKNKAPAFTGWEAWGYLNQKMNLLLTRLLNLDMNVIVNVHYKDKITKTEDKESHELMLQLQGETADTAFNDFDQVGWMGVYWEAEAGERIQKRGLTFKPTPDKPFLKDRLHVTPKWMEVTFTAEDYEMFFKRINAKMNDLVHGQDVGEIPSAEPDSDIPGGIRAPSEVASGALPAKDVPLTSMDKPTLMGLIRDLGLTTLVDGTPIRGNTVKAELIAAIEKARQTPPTADEAHTKVPRATITVPRQSTAPDVERVAEGLVDTRTGELLEPNGGGIDTLERPAVPSVEDAVAAVAETLGGKVIEQPPAPAPQSTTPAERPVCEECGKDLAGEDQNFVKLGWIKYRRRLCAADYQKRKAG